MNQIINQMINQKHKSNANQIINQMMNQKHKSIMNQIIKETYEVW